MNAKLIARMNIVVRYAAPDPDSLMESIVVGSWDEALLMISKWDGPLAIHIEGDRRSSFARIVVDCR